MSDIQAPVKSVYFTCMQPTEWIEIHLAPDKISYFHIHSLDLALTLLI